VLTAWSSCSGPWWSAASELAVAPVTKREERFTATRALDLVYRLGLSPRRRPAAPLARDEWWVHDLSDELGVSYLRLKDSRHPSEEGRSSRRTAPSLGVATRSCGVNCNAVNQAARYL
jgi:hypothetical protein